MIRAMYSAITGMKAHMDKMDIVGNNIANVNTTGYKSSRATFKTIMSQTVQGATAPQNGRGGTNPQQIGLGVALGSIDKNMKTGNTQTTGRSLDFAIEGNGFFIVNDGMSDFYTRAGAISEDKQGYLVNATNGFKLQGWMADNNNDNNIDTTKKVEDLKLTQTMSGEATTMSFYQGNLDRDTAVGDSVPPTTMNIYDSQGAPYTVSLEFTKTATNQWEYNVTKINDANGTDLMATAGVTPNLSANTVEFDTKGNLLSIGGTSLDADSDGVVSKVEKDNFDAHPQLSFDPGTGVSPLDIAIDLREIIQNKSNVEDIKSYASNGYQTGTLKNIEVDKAGVVTGFYDNGRTQSIAQIALATFSNPSGLTAEAGTIFTESTNSGQAQIGTPNGGGLGSVAGSTLEMSNVDLSREFTEMITTQRGFQANSKIISTSDQILQDLVNLKR